jgi:type IV pilus assembly protein PilA
MTNLLRNKRGVTLVELLAVIIIMGIIAAIAVPTIGNLIENQRVKAAEAEWVSIQESARTIAVELEEDDTITWATVKASLSGAVLLSLTTAGAEIADSTVLFVVGTNGTVSVAAAITTLFIDTYQVYPAV